MSSVGRWDPVREIWMVDDDNSPCIDAGNPESDWTEEPEPNGRRINIGAYGGTDQASWSVPTFGERYNLPGSWSVRSMGWEGGWPISLDGTDYTVDFDFDVDEFTMTVWKSDVPVCETIGAYHGSEDRISFAITRALGECEADFLGQTYIYADHPYRQHS